MKIAINILPLQTGHKNRGIGYYTKNLIEELEKDNSLEIVKYIKHEDLNFTIDLIHYPWFELFYHQLPLRNKYPFVVTIHDLMPLLFPENYPIGFKGQFNNMLQRQALKKCRKIITDSQASKKDIIRYLKVKEDKVKVVPLAIRSEFKILPETQLLRIKRKYNLPDNFLLYVGDANYVKNLPFLIQGFNELVKSNKFSNYKLVLVGGVFLKNVENIDHPELESLKQVNRMIKRYQLEDLVIKPGFLEIYELASFYNLATAYIQPSLYEGFGLPVLEAMACGAPVISSNLASLPEVGGDSVVYFDPLNINQFTRILAEVLEDKSLQYKLSKIGLKQAKLFSWQKTAEKTKGIYYQAIKNE